MTVQDRTFSGFITGKNIFRVGLGLLLLGLFLLFKLGIDRGWIGPEVRLAAGAVTSAALVGIGLRIADHRPTFGTLLQGGGVAGLFATTYAGHAVMGLVGETAAYIQLVAIVAAATALALRSDSQALGVVGVAGGLAAPLVIGASAVLEMRDVAYLAALLGLAATLFINRSWTGVYGVAVVGGALLVLPQIILRALVDSDPMALQLVLATYWVALFAAPIGAAAGRVLDTLAEKAAQAGSVAVPLIAFGGSALLWFEDDTRVVLGVAAAALAAVHVGLRGLLAGRVDRDTADVQLIPASVLALSSPLLALGGPFVLPIVAGIGLSMAVGGRLIHRPSVEGLGHGVLALVTLRALVSEDMLDLYRGGFDVDALASLGVLLVLAIGGVVFLSGRLPSTIDNEATGQLYLTVAYFGIGLWGWLAFAAVSLGAVTVVWGVLGLAALILGLAADDPTVLSIGGGVLLVTIGKLLLIDLVFVDAVWRILLSLGFGLVFLVLGYWIAARRGEV